MKRRLLIVEDDQGIRHLMVSALEKEGFLVHIASDGAEKAVRSESSFTCA